MSAELSLPALEQAEDPTLFDCIRGAAAEMQTKLGRIGLSTLLTASAAVGLVATGESPAQANEPEATVGMPFQGKWAYNALVKPPYTDANSSHPSVHTAHGFDWATDLYAASGTDVRVYGSSSQGAVTFRRSAASDTCSSYGPNVAGKGVTFDVLVNGVDVGDLKYDHLNFLDIGNGPVASGTKIGTVTGERLHPLCFQARHVHIQFRNTGGNFSCFTDHGQPGITLNAGVALGRVGSDNTGAKQRCGPESAPPPPPPPNTDGDSLYDFEDACPVEYGTPLLSGCPAEHKTAGDFNGDGYGDVLVSSVYPDGEGMAMHLYKGSAGGLTGSDFQQELTPAYGGWAFRRSKMVAANVDGDAYTDLVIFHQGLSDEIVRHIFKGSATGIQANDPNTSAIQYPYQGWKWSNLHVAGAGDFNGDGYDDIAVFSAYPGGEDAALYSYFGSPTGLAPAFQRELTSRAGGWNLKCMKPLLSMLTAMFTTIWSSSIRAPTMKLPGMCSKARQRASRPPNQT